MKKIIPLTILVVVLGFLCFKLYPKTVEHKEVLLPITSNLDKISPEPSGPVPQKKLLQYVILSFDGSESLDMWEATRNFAKEMKAQNKPVNFTYYVSGVYFLSAKDKNNYLPPQHKAGQSAIGFSHSADDIPKRINEMNLAISEGHEIASHLNGHWDGSQWTEADWKSEIDQFKKFVPLSNLNGIRTPLLARNKSFYKAISTEGFKYDSSSVGKMGNWPQKNEYGTWEIPLVTINIPGVNKNTLSMDYNEYLVQTNAKDILKKGTAAWNTAFNQILAADENYFNKNYSGNRSPVVIGNHFSLWNDGLYWESMKAFAQKVCGQPDVRCTTFSNLVDYLNKVQQ